MFFTNDMKIHAHIPFLRNRVLKKMENLAGCQELAQCVRAALAEAIRLKFKLHVPPLDQSH